ncbi:MAG: hypothetical protein ACYS5F_15710 [Planctomycetota bacterium]|jgi:hypothetical protein
MVVSIDQVLSDFIQQEMQNMDLDDMICETVRMSFEVDDIEDHGSSIEEIQQTLFDIQDKFDPQNVINLENSVRNLVEHVNELQDRVNVLQSLQLERKSFLSRLFF